ncbi:MAG: response regulator [Lachnospiraceae bacterium]|nr:response regulator [Lachnospiraceae bacterium]
MHIVMVVDDNKTDLLIAEKALEGTYRVLVEQDGKHALEYMRAANKLPSLILLDIDMHGMNGFELYSKMASEAKLKDIPVIFVSGLTDTATELEAYQLGAVDYMEKPFVPEILKKKVGLHIGIVEDKARIIEQNSILQDYNVQLQDYNGELQTRASEATKNLANLEYFIIGVLEDLITKKDGFTGSHCRKVSRYMEILLKRMMRDNLVRLPIKDLSIIIMSSQLIDMGKIGVPDRIVQKEGKYTPAEFDLMKKHTVFAADSIERFSYLVSNSSFITYAYQMARSHHEQWCGNGYPDGLKGTEIPQLARIVSVCDVYDALVSKRTYKKEMTHEQACAVINQVSGTQFDPAVVAEFNKVVDEFREIYNQERTTGDTGSTVYRGMLDNNI